MKTPDITPAQYVALVGSLLAALVAFGAPVSPEQTQAILDLTEKVAMTLLLTDFGIRYGRGKHLAKKDN